MLLLEEVCKSGKLTGITSESKNGARDDEAVIKAADVSLGHLFLSRWLCLFFQACRVSMPASSTKGFGDRDREQQLPRVMSERLGKLPCLPLSDGSLTSLREGRVFFAPSEFGKDATVDFGLISSELRILSVELENGCDSPAMKATVHRALVLIGVCQLTNKLIIQEHIAPRLRQLLLTTTTPLPPPPPGHLPTADDAHSSRALPPWCDPSSAVVLSKETQAIKQRVIAYVRFVKECCFPKDGSKSRLPAHRDVLSALVNELGGLPLPVCRVKETKKQFEHGQYHHKRGYDLGPLVALSFVSGRGTYDGLGVNDVHLPVRLTKCPELTEQFWGSFSTVLKQARWKVLDMGVLTGNASWEQDPAETKSWKEFLQILELPDFVAVRKRRVPLEELRSNDSRWKLGLADDAHHATLWKDLEAETRWVEDAESPELEHVLSAFSKTKKNNPNTGEEKDEDVLEVDGYVLAGYNAALGILCRTWHSSGFDPQTHVTIHGSSSSSSSSSSYHEEAASAVYGGLIPSQIRGADRSRNTNSSRGGLLLPAKVSLPASSFLLALTASPWIPALPEGTGSSSSSSSSRKKQGGCFLYRPRAIFAEVQGLHSNMKQYFGDLVPMLDPRLDVPRGFADSLGIQTQV